MKRMVTKEFKEQIDMIYEFINKKITNLITLWIFLLISLINNKKYFFWPFFWLFTKKFLLLNSLFYKGKTNVFWPFIFKYSLNTSCKQTENKVLLICNKNIWPFIIWYILKVNYYFHKVIRFVNTITSINFKLKYLWLFKILF